jgi:hypothetical protein
MDKITSAIALAVEHLQDGKTELAMEHFTIVIADISRRMCSYPGPTPSDPLQDSAALHMFNVAISSPRVKSSGHSAVELFENAFLVSSSTRGTLADNSLSEFQAVCCTAVCFYNLGLIYATKNPTDFDSLKKAIGLFEKTCELVQTTHRLLDQDSLLVLCAAAANNLAALYDSFGNIERVNTCGKTCLEILGSISFEARSDPVYQTIWMKCPLDSCSLKAARAA